jgi:hypothetical protein
MGGPAEVEKYVLKSTDIAQCYRHKKLDCLRRDAALTNRGLRQKDRGTRVAAWHRNHAQVDPGCWWEGGAASQQRCRLPQRGALAQHGARVRHFLHKLFGIRYTDVDPRQGRKK